MNMEIFRHMFKSFYGVNELIIKHPPHIRTIDLAQYILDLQSEVVMLKNIVVDLRRHEKIYEEKESLDITRRN